MDIFFSINTPLNPLSRGETVLSPPREGRRGGSKQSQNHAQKRLKLTAKRVFSIKNLVDHYDPENKDITIQPFLGYLMLLEESEGSTFTC
jgi:hypothetical protein